MTVRLRPNGPYLVFLVVAAAVLTWGVVRGGPIGAAVAVGGALMLAVFAYPVLVSTVFRIPVIAIDDDGIRLPLMGVRLPWDGVSSTGLGALPRRPGTFLLLIIPVDAEATVAQVRPWLRREARRSLAQYGTPISLSDLSLDHSSDDIAAAIARGPRPDSH
jgi:hypothetical protein